MYLMIDNKDSFVYNLVAYFRELGAEVLVRTNDEITLEECARLEQLEGIILSPGPGVPSESGILLDVIKKYAPTKSILGVCLGEQAIGEAFGGTLINLPDVFHGVSSKINVIADDILFYDMLSTLEVGRYHSWAVSKDNFPDLFPS